MSMTLKDLAHALAALTTPPGGHWPATMSFFGPASIGYAHEGAGSGGFACRGARVARELAGVLWQLGCPPPDQMALQWGGAGVLRWGGEEAGRAVEVLCQDGREGVRIREDGWMKREWRLTW